MMIVMKINKLNKLIIMLFAFIALAIGTFVYHQTAIATDDFQFENKMSFALLSKAVNANVITQNNTIPISVFVGDIKQDTPKSMSAGVIDATTVPQIDHAVFEGAYVEFSDGTETPLHYANTYQENDKSYTYYAYSTTPETGVLLPEGAYIKLAYQGAYNISYSVQDTSGNSLSKGMSQDDLGGYFVTPSPKCVIGQKLQVHFICQNKAGSGGQDYRLKRLYVIDSENNQTDISYNLDDAGSYVPNSDSTIVAVVEPVTQYRMHVVNPFSEHHGYICWKGYSGTYNPKTNTIDNSDGDASLTNNAGISIHAKAEIKDTKSANTVATVKDEDGKEHYIEYEGDDGTHNLLYQGQDNFCSYTKQILTDESGNVVNSGSNVATTSASPGGTFYFVMYSQKGTNWQFDRLAINGIALDAQYDGKVHDTKLDHGMVAHFKFDRYEDYQNYSVNYDLHLEKDREDSNSLLKRNKRLKFECWVTNASRDINVDFDCNAVNSESLTLTKAVGVKRIVADSYDEDHDNNKWWDSLYNGEPYYRKKDLFKWEEVNQDGKRSPDHQYIYGDASEDGTLPRTLFDETVRSDGYTSNQWHTQFEAPGEVGSERHLYFDVLPGYDSKTTKVYVTGADYTSDYKPVAKPISKMYMSYNNTYHGKQKAIKSFAQAMNDGYTNFIKYYSVNQPHRNIQVEISPYKFDAVYDLKGGTLNGKDSYVDDKKYSIEEGSNHILMPTATPVKKGYVFAGWKMIPTNSDTDIQKNESIKRILMPNETYTVDTTTYNYGRDTEKQEITYQLYNPTTDKEDNITKTLFDDKDDGYNHYTFEAQWVDSSHIPAGKGIYNIQMYKEIHQADYPTKASDDYTTKEENGVTKYYHKISDHNYLGTLSQTIIGIPPKDESGYVLNKKDSVLKLENFQTTGPKTLKYYYDFDGTQNLKIQNSVSGNMGDDQRDFHIKVTLKDESGNSFNGSVNVEGSNASIWGDAPSTGNQATGTMSFTNGEAHITLKANQYIVFKNIEPGTYSVEETKDRLYVTQYQLNKETKQDTAIENKTIKRNDSPIVTIYNVRDMPATGVIDSHKPMIVFVLGLLSLLLCGCLLWIRKKRHS